MDECPPERWPDARQQAKRLQRMLRVTIHARRFGSAEVVVRNISASGLGGSSDQWLIAGEGVEVELPNLGRVTGTIAWVEGRRFGLAFEAAIDPSRVLREAAPGMDRSFRVMDRYRPEAAPWRPPLNLR